MNCNRLDVTKETGQVNTMLDPEFDCGSEKGHECGSW